MITSIQNTQVKKWKKLHNKKYREKQKRFLIEGMHLIEEAFKSDWEFESLIVRENEDIPSWASHLPIFLVRKQVYKEISQTESPQGISAVIKMKQMQSKIDEFVLLIDAVQDPGNLGTIIRTADAAGFSKIVLGPGTVDLYNDKVIRATQGSLFHIPIVQEDLLTTVEQLKKQDFIIWASALENAIHLNECNSVKEKMALIIGNEGTGVQSSLLKAADKIVKIPIIGKVESLNVSVAAGILMYKLRENNFRSN